MNGIPSAISSLLSNLADRQRAVIVNRFGLEGREPQTLAMIGETFGITRERVRQIEAGSITALRADFLKDKVLGAFTLAIAEKLKQMGGVVKESEFIQSCASSYAGVTAPHLIFLARVSGRFHFFAENEEHHSFFYADEKAMKKAEQTILRLAKYMKSKQDRVSAGQSREVFESFIRAEKITKEFADHCVATSKLFHVNAFGDFGLAEWPEIRPQTIRDRIYLILKKEQKPMHFRIIATSINDVGLGKKMALVPTVHNELIKDERFILVGRGMYALEEHGYQPGTARDVITRILKKKGPMSSEDIVLAVQKERFFKPNTVVANLQNKKNFSRRSDGLYQVREA